VGRFEGGHVVATKFQLELNAKIHEQAKLCLRQLALIEELNAQLDISLDRMLWLLELAETKDENG
jgi:hypothetical protein